MNQIQVEFEKQEHAQLFKDYEEYYDIFEKYFDSMLELTIFEYQLVKIYTIDRDDYKKYKENKKNCFYLNQRTYQKYL